MKYRKPELLVLGDVNQVVLSTCDPKSTQVSDAAACGGMRHAINAAYDLDE